MPNMTIGGSADDTKVEPASARFRPRSKGVKPPLTASATDGCSGTESALANGAHAGQGGYFAEHH